MVQSPMEVSVCSLLCGVSELSRALSTTSLMDAGCPGVLGRPEIAPWRIYILMAWFVQAG